MTNWTFAERAPMARVQGERLYARAKADMDGLVRLLTADLATERSLAESPELQHRLEAVMAQRRALCRHVDAAVGSEHAEHEPVRPMPRRQLRVAHHGRELARRVAEAP